ncbi:MAG: polysaccharide biosynthesis C-terminal domain-containing protein, partial [Gammaproteobacteria bacterium]
IAFAALRLATTLIYLKREYSRSLKYDYNSWKKHLAYALPFALAIVLETVQANLHFYVVSSRFDAAIFAIYAVGCLQVPLTDFLMTSTSSVMMVRMREEASRGNNNKVLALWRDTTRKLAFLIVPFVGTLVVTAHALIVTLYTARYVDSVGVFELWSATSIFSILLAHSVMRVYAKTRFLIILSIVKLAVIAATIILFLDWFGLIGGVLSTLIATLVSKFISLWKTRQVLQCRVSELLPWRALARIVGMALVAALPAMAIRFFAPIPQIAELFLIPALYLGTYTTLVWWRGLILPHEKQLVMNFVKRFTVRYLIPRRL